MGAAAELDDSGAQGHEALASIFAARKEDGSFDEGMERKLDDLLRAGSKKRVRVNADNESFHIRDGISGIQRGGAVQERGERWSRVVLPETMGRSQAQQETGGSG